LKIYQKKYIFYFLKIIFDINTSKYLKTSKNINLKQKINKKFNFFLKILLKYKKNRLLLLINNSKNEILSALIIIKNKFFL